MHVSRIVYIPILKFLPWKNLIQINVNLLEVRKSHNFQGRHKGKYSKRALDKLFGASISNDRGINWIESYVHFCYFCSLVSQHTGRVNG